MKDKKSIAKRLMVLYVSFILVIVLSLVAKIIPDSKSGYKAGITMSEMMHRASENHNRVYMLPSIDYELFCNESQLAPLDDSLTQVKFYAESASFIISEYSQEEATFFSSIGGNSAHYYVNLLYMATFIWMLVLIAKIILSLRRSMIDELPISRANILRVRLIGSIVIITELINTAQKWSMQNKAAEVLEGYNLNIDTAFSPDYWLIMLGILILFMGELFAIAHSLSEEQKLTI